MLKSKCEQSVLARQCDIAVSQLRDVARQLEDAEADDAYPVGLVAGILHGAIAALEAIDWDKPMRSGGGR